RARSPRHRAAAPGPRWTGTRCRSTSACRSRAEPATATARLGGPMDTSEMRRILDRERARGLGAISAAASIAELEAAVVAVLGRKSALGEVQRSLGALDEQDRRELGKLVNETRQELAAAREPRRAELDEVAEAGLLAADAVDLSLPGRRAHAGSYHPLTLLEPEIGGGFLRAGVRVAGGSGD